MCVTKCEGKEGYFATLESAFDKEINQNRKFIFILIR